MKKSILTLAFSFLIAILSIDAQTYDVETAKSRVRWRSTKITGEHSGYIKITKGNVVLTKGKITGGEFIIDMKGILVTDTEDADKRKDIVDDISGKTFFNVAEHPTAKFVINGYFDKMLSGDLTIKGVTNRIQFKVSYKVIENRLIANTITFTISRKKWKLKLSNWIKEAAVNDDLEFKIHIESK